MEVCRHGPRPARTGGTFVDAQVDDSVKVTAFLQVVGLVRRKNDTDRKLAVGDDDGGKVFGTSPDSRLRGDEDGITGTIVPLGINIVITV